MKDTEDPTVRLFILRDAFSTVVEGSSDDITSSAVIFTDSIIGSDITLLVPSVEKVRVTSVAGQDAVAVRLKADKNWGDRIELKDGTSGSCISIVQGMFEKRIVPGLTGADLPQVPHDFNKVSNKDIGRIFQAILPTVMLQHDGGAEITKIDRESAEIQAKMTGNCPSCTFGTVANTNTVRKIEKAVSKYLGMKVKFP